MGLGLRPLVVLALVAALLVLRWRRAGILSWALGWWAGMYVLFKWGFVVPVPGSVVTLYMSIVTLSILAYVSSSRERWQEFTTPIVRLVTEPRLRPALLAVLLLLPALVALNVWARMSVPLEAPSFGRTVHPAPPDTIKVHDNEINLITGENPYRKLQDSDPDAFRRHVENGRRVYFSNCFYCHGDAAAGDGMFAHGLNPIPTNFTDLGILPMFQESFLFWRISKGGPGLPEEGGPWDSAMPAWENFLTEEEMWDVILFLYDYTGLEPRARHEIAH
jgi:mono/diheme cytochrome c family protein